MKSIQEPDFKRKKGDQMQNQAVRKTGLFGFAISRSWGFFGLNPWTDPLE
jgi:hypothetical protein